MIDDIELLGNKKEREVVEQLILDRVPVLIWGEPGIGKTSTVYYIAKKHGFKVIEYNASDQRKKETMLNILDEVQKPSLFKKIYLFDEIDGMEDYYTLLKIINKSQYPIAMTANDIHKIPDKVRSSLEKYVRIIRFYPPSKREIVELAKNKFSGSNLSVISSDVRNTLITLTTGCEPRLQDENIFEIVENIFKGKPFPTSEQFWKYNKLWIWVLDNLTKYYDGVKLFKAINILADASLYNKPYLLKSLPKTKQMKSPSYPYYLKRKGVINNK